jgi:hypothetical protein
MERGFDIFLPEELEYPRRIQHMNADREKTVQPGGPGNEKKTAEPQTQAAGDACRCKETALMTPRQLLRLMISDLSFRKKGKKG